MSASSSGDPSDLRPCSFRAIGLVPGELRFRRRWRPVARGTHASAGHCWEVCSRRWPSGAGRTDRAAPGGDAIQLQRPNHFHLGCASFGAGQLRNPRFVQVLGVRSRSLAGGHRITGFEVGSVRTCGTIGGRSAVRREHAPLGIAITGVPLGSGAGGRRVVQIIKPVPSRGAIALDQRRITINGIPIHRIAIGRCGSSTSRRTSVVSRRSKVRAARTGFPAIVARNVPSVRTSGVRVAVPRCAEVVVRNRIRIVERRRTGRRRAGCNRPVAATGCPAAAGTAASCSTTAGTAAVTDHRAAAVATARRDVERLRLAAGAPGIAGRHHRTTIGGSVGIRGIRRGIRHRSAPAATTKQAADGGRLDNSSQPRLSRAGRSRRQHESVDKTANDGEKWNSCDQSVTCKRGVDGSINRLKHPA